MKLLFVDLETTGLKPEKHRITVLGCGDGETVCTITGDEKEILKVLVDLLRRTDVVVGYNILDFDGPFAEKRAKVHSIECRDVQVRAIDLLRVVLRRCRLARYKLTYVAETLAGVSCGEDISGEEAARLSQCGELEKVEEHCAKDIVRVVHLYRALVEAGALNGVESEPWLRVALESVAGEVSVRVHNIPVLKAEKLTQTVATWGGRGLDNLTGDDKRTIRTSSPH